MSKNLKILLIIAVLLALGVIVFGFWYFFRPATPVVVQPTETKQCFTIQQWVDNLKDQPQKLHEFYKNLYTDYYYNNRIDAEEKAFDNNNFTFYFTCLGVINEDLSYCDDAKELEDSLLRPHYDQAFLDSFNGYKGADYTCKLAFNQTGNMIVNSLAQSQAAGQCEFDLQKWHDQNIGFSDWNFLADCGIDWTVLDDLFCDAYYRKQIDTNKVAAAISQSSPLCQYYLKTMVSPSDENCQDENYKLEPNMELNDCLTSQQQYLSFINNDETFCDKIDNEYGKKGLSANACKLFHNYNFDYCIKNYLNQNLNDEVCF